MPDPRQLSDEEKQLRSAYQAVFGTPAGHTVLADLLENVCRVGECPFNRDSARQTTFNLGRQSVGLYVQTKMES